METLNTLFKKNLWKSIVIIFLICTISLITLEGAWCDKEVLKKFIEEIIIVVGAAVIVSLYFEFHLRKEISFEFNKILEMKEEFGKAGIIKYYPNFRDINLRSFFTNDVRSIDIYANFAHTVFNQVQDSISKLVQNENIELNIYLLDSDNKFILGLGELWGKSNSEYDEEGIKTKIKQSLSTLESTFNELKVKGELKAKIKIYLLKKNPVFYSFYRFDNEMIYVPSKIVEPKSFIPLSFLIKKTTHSEGIYNKCMEELRIIKQDQDSLTTYFTN